MSTFFDQIVRFAYSKGLHEHLKGLDNSCETYAATSTYGFVFLVVGIICPMIMVNYYYIIFNRPRFSTFFWWLMNVLLAAIIAFCTAFFRASADLHNNNFCKDQPFSSMDCMLFGATAALYSVVICAILSLAIKWWSLNNKKVPF